MNISQVHHDDISVFTLQGRACRAFSAVTKARSAKCC